MGRWIKTQRQKYRNGEMSKDRINCLESIPGWQWTFVKVVSSLES